MKNQSLVIKIFLWVEVVFSARILLFTAPVLITKCLEKTWYAKDLSDWYILIITFAALLYLLAGISSILGLKLWKLFQFLVAALTISMTVGFLGLVVKEKASVTVIYALPAIISFVIAVIVGTAKAQIQSE